MTLLMGGFVDAVFQSVPVSIEYETGGGYVDGIWIDGTTETVSYIANIQPLTEREIDNLFRAGERVIDGRKVYINDGDLAKLELGQDLLFLNERWKIVRRDIRAWRSYAKITVSRYDIQSSGVPAIDPPTDLLIEYVA